MKKYLNFSKKSRRAIYIIAGSAKADRLCMYIIVEIITAVNKEYYC